MFILDCKEENRAVKIDLRQAFTMIRHAWESVTEKCIKNCWKLTQILSIDSKNDSTSEAEDIQPPQDVAGVDKLRSVLHKMLRSLVIDINAYVDVDPAFPTQELTDTEICQFVAHLGAVSQDEPEKEEEEPPSPIKS